MPNQGINAKIVRPGGSAIAVLRGMDASRNRRATMLDTRWIEAIERWRGLPPEERRRRHLVAIPRHVANSMAMEGEPVDEAWIRERLARRLPPLVVSKPPSAS